MKKYIVASLMVLLSVLPTKANFGVQKPIRLAVAGMSHGHISFILGRADKKDFEVVGIWESNNDLVKRRTSEFNLQPELVYSNLSEMLDRVQPEAVVAFGSVFDHLAVVKACAPRGIHVMVEKPLAVNMEHAKKMAQLASEYNIHLLTNYETSWYPTTAWSLNTMSNDNAFGPIRKVVIHDGHEGPKEIGVDNFFLDWLTDPVQNGGGAVVDFGCYGANLMTALTNGEKPISVTAVLRQFKPDVYPNVDDEATIIVSYPQSQCIIQASWNWPFGRKDMEIYTTQGYIRTVDEQNAFIRNRSTKGEEKRVINSDDVAVYTDPFSYFYDVLTNKIEVEPYSLYSLENNVRVVEILDAARKSAKEGRTVYWD